jgi:hypothetical protein
LKPERRNVYTESFFRNYAVISKRERNSGIQNEEKLVVGLWNRLFRAEGF